MKRNILRELLNAGKPTLGTHVITPWPGIVEVIGHSGAFDYIEYVGEYSPFSLEQLDNFGRTIELFPNMSSMMKVEEQTRGFIATRAIGSGIQNVLFTDIRNAKEVRECINLIRPEPPGSHGCSMRRNVGYVLEAGSQSWTEAMNNIVVAVMIEKKEAMDNLDEILSVEGVDMVQFGPADYSITVGKAGHKQSLEILAVQREMIKRALKKGVAPRAEIVGVEDAKPFVEMGVRHFCIGWDLRVIFNWCKQQAQGMKNLLRN
jgi:2-keto-3-deoxy-L-rhamnonate aldolase RhmA